MSVCKYVTTTRFTLIQRKFVYEFKCSLDFVTDCSHVDSVRSLQRKGRAIGGFQFVGWVGGLVGWSIPVMRFRMSPSTPSNDVLNLAHVCWLINHSILGIHVGRLHGVVALKFANLILVHTEGAALIYVHFVHSRTMCWAGPTHGTHWFGGGRWNAAAQWTSMWCEWMSFRFTGKRSDLIFQFSVAKLGHVLGFGF